MPFPPSLHPARAGSLNHAPAQQSTILKQMKLIHQGSYSDKERENYKEIIYSNTVQSMHVSFSRALSTRSSLPSRH